MKGNQMSDKKNEGQRSEHPKGGSDKSDISIHSEQPNKLTTAPPPPPVDKKEPTSSR